MPLLLHGLGYRPQLANETSEETFINSLHASQKHVLSSRQATLSEPQVTTVAGLKDSPAYDASQEGDQTKSVKIESDDIDDNTQTSKERKRGPRVRYTLNGPSPFPDLLNPVPTAYQHVHDLLSEKHEKREMPPNIPPPSQSVAGCGEVNFVLEALIRTIISTHTHMSNADKAIKNVCNRYPVFQHGDFAGSVDWDTVRVVGAEDLEEAIRPAGKAKTTSVAIIGILETVKSENDQRRMRLLNGSLAKYQPKGSPLTRAELLSKRADEMLLTTPNFLTLDYLHTEPARDVFERLQQFHGVGVKTAACILLFCFQYPAFAVDTHVWRLCKLLGWAPASADRDQTFFHLDPLVPAQLKYGLHQLFIAHGKACVRCSGRSLKNANGSESEECVLESLVTRSNLDKPLMKKRRGAKTTLVDVSEEQAPKNDSMQSSPISDFDEALKGSEGLKPVGNMHDSVGASKAKQVSSKRHKRPFSNYTSAVADEGRRRSKRIAVRKPALTLSSADEYEDT